MNKKEALKIKEPTWATADLTSYGYTADETVILLIFDKDIACFYVWHPATNRYLTRVAYTQVKELTVNFTPMVRDLVTGILTDKDRIFDEVDEVDDFGNPLQEEGGYLYTDPYSGVTVKAPSAFILTEGELAIDPSTYCFDLPILIDKKSIFHVSGTEPVSIILPNGKGSRSITNNSLRDFVYSLYQAKIDSLELKVSLEDSFGKVEPFPLLDYFVYPKDGLKGVVVSIEKGEKEFLTLSGKKSVKRSLVEWMIKFLPAVLCGARPKILSYSGLFLADGKNYSSWSDVCNLIDQPLPKQFSWSSNDHSIRIQVQLADREPYLKVFEGDKALKKLYQWLHVYASTFCHT